MHPKRYVTKYNVSGGVPLPELNLRLCFWLLWIVWLSVKRQLRKRVILKRQNAWRQYMMVQNRKIILLSPSVRSSLLTEQAFLIHLY